MESASATSQVYDNRQEDYLAAQRAGAEALFVGRATLTQASQQGEQLDRANDLADETEHTLQKAGRVLRGMTWSGWVANMFSPGTGPPPDVDTTPSGRSQARTPPAVYEGLPVVCQETAQCIQNYHANVKVLEACETEEQKATCRMICENMYTAAQAALVKLANSHSEVDAYTLQLGGDLESLRHRQTSSQQQLRGMEQVVDASETAAHQRSQLMPQQQQQSTTTAGETDAVLLQQEAHLDTIAQTLGELGSIAQTLQLSMAQQNETMNQLDTKSDNIMEKSRMVNRRTERLIQKKSWTPVKPTFHANVSIRHAATGLYLSVLKGELFLVKKFHPETCVFGLWKRQGQILGLKNEHSRKWVGQNMFGNLACSASSFGRREEWETTAEDWTATPLLCASAGWGNGGYLMVRRKDFGLLLGGGTAQDREVAAVWRISEMGNEE